MQAYDIIGDIHGHADELHALLEKLGYRNRTASHSEGRKVIFLGDFIDRGPKIREALETVRGMVEAGTALAILGNHEVNAMRFHAKGSDGEYLRPHTDKNVKQHQATLTQFPDEAAWSGWIQWFAGGAPANATHRNVSRYCVCIAGKLHILKFNKTTA